MKIHKQVLISDFQYFWFLVSYISDLLFQCFNIFDFIFHISYFQISIFLISIFLISIILIPIFLICTFMISLFLISLLDFWSPSNFYILAWISISLLEFRFSFLYSDFLISTLSLLNVCFRLTQWEFRKNVANPWWIFV